MREILGFLDHLTYLARFLRLLLHLSSCYFSICHCVLHSASERSRVSKSEWTCLYRAHRHTHTLLSEMHLVRVNSRGKVGEDREKRRQGNGEE